MRTVAFAYFFAARNLIKVALFIAYSIAKRSIHMIVIITVKLLFAYVFILSVEFEHFNGFY